MFYETTIKTHVRVPPEYLDRDKKEAVAECLGTDFENLMSKELGIVFAVTEIVEVGDGIVIPGDGASYYETKARVLTFKPDLQEVVLGRIRDITDFGAFIEIGPIDGMIHVSQAMDDYVSFSKTNVLTGKESNRVLKVGDLCRARIIAISYKDMKNPKIGLTMRQPLLGSLRWVDEELKKVKKEEIAPKEAKK